MSHAHRFTPSRSGFRFSCYSFKVMSAVLITRNSSSFAPPGDLVDLYALGKGRVFATDSGNGMAAGMAFAAVDYFEAGIAPPEEAGPPLPNSALFNYLDERHTSALEENSNDSLPLMNPLRPDFPLPLIPWLQARSRILVEQEWPQIKVQLDEGHPCPITIVRAKSWSALKTRYNHQVVAYTYDLAGEQLKISVYDPSRPGDDNVVVRLSLGARGSTTGLEYSPGWSDFPRIYGFVQMRYTPMNPPAPPAINC